MYMVYWTIVDEDGQHAAGAAVRHQRDGGGDGFMEELRRRQRAGEGVRFITMCSEHPDVVGHPGVDVTGPDYNWKKRRR